jgi:hypothetical protein
MRIKIAEDHKNHECVNNSLVDGACEASCTKVSISECVIDPVGLNCSAACLCESTSRKSIVHTPNELLWLHDRYFENPGLSGSTGHCFISLVKTKHRDLVLAGLEAEFRLRRTALAVERSRHPSPDVHALWEFC